MGLNHVLHYLLVHSDPRRLGLGLIYDVVDGRSGGPQLWVDCQVLVALILNLRPGFKVSTVWIEQPGVVSDPPSRTGPVRAQLGSVCLIEVA